MAPKGHLPSARSLVTWVTLRLVTAGRTRFRNGVSQRLRALCCGAGFTLSFPGLRWLRFAPGFWSDAGTIALVVSGKRLLIVCTGLHSEAEDDSGKHRQVIDKYN